MKFLDLPEDFESPSWDSFGSQTIIKLPLVAAQIRDLQCQCPRMSCTGVDKTTAFCMVEDLKDDLTQLAANISAVSLFDCINPVVLFLGHLRSDAGDRKSFIMAPQEILSGEGSPFCHIRDILGYASDMFGHDVQDVFGDTDWIALEGRGQVLYPMLYDTLHLDSRGLLQLGGLAGRPTYSQQAYSKVGAISEKTRHTPISQEDLK